MKLVRIGLFGKVIDLFSKRSKNGEKIQEIQEKKLDIFKLCLTRITYILIVLVILNIIFPSLYIGDWTYNLLDRILIYMME